MLLHYSTGVGTQHVYCTTRTSVAKGDRLLFRNISINYCYYYFFHSSTIDFIILKLSNAHNTDRDALCTAQRRHPMRPIRIVVPGRLPVCTTSAIGSEKREPGKSSEQNFIPVFRSV